MSEINHDDLNQLVQELQANKPAAPLPPAQFTADLRRQLLEEYVGKRRLRFDFDLLRSMAGSAAAFIVLGAAVFVAWFVFSRGQAGVDTLEQIGDWQPAAGEDRAWLISAMPPPDTNLSTLSIRPIRFTLEIGYELDTAPQALLLVELVPAKGAEGNVPPLVRYGSSQWLPITGPEGRVTVEVTMSDLLPGQMTPDIVPQVSFRLPGPETTDVFYQQTLDNVRWTWPDNIVDRVWVISVHQAARTAAGAPIEFEVVMGYELVSAPEATMKLHLAHPDWESAGGGPAPIDGVTEPVPVTADQDSVTFNFIVNPAEVESITGTPGPVLVAMLSEPAPVEADGRLDTYAVETFTDLPASLFALDKPVPVPPDEMGARGTIGMVSIQPDVSPPVETTLTGIEPVTFEAPIFYELSGVRETEIEVLLSQQTADGAVSAWQALDTERVPVQAGRGLFNVVFTLDPAIHLREPATIEITVGMVVPGSEEYRITNGGVASRSWRYEP